MKLAPALARLFLPLAALFALAAPAPAQQGLPSPQMELTGPVAVHARPALWQVADDDTTIYLFGTVHALPPEIEWFDVDLADRLARSDELVTEIPEVSDQERAEVVLKYGILPGSKSLRAGLTKAENAKLAKALKSLRLAPTAVDRYRPWFAAVNLVLRKFELAGYTRMLGVEEVLAGRARELGKRRIGLETLDQQIAMFAGFSPAVQKRYLFETIDALPQVEPEMGKIIKAWSAGDADQLAALLNSEEDDPAMMEVLFSKRNKAWARWLKARLDRPGTVFVAVGAGHLGMKGSVQDELAALGLKVSRVQ